MKKNTLNTAVLASLAGIAGIANISNAVNLNPDGTGSVLIYPYYTVNTGNQTLISVVNTTNLGKAVKVRFIEGRNSREVLDFNLYLSAQDVWTAAVFDPDLTGAASLTGAAAVITRDQSCTSPQFSAAGTSLGGVAYVEFKNFQYTGTFADGGLTSIDRTREGYIEIIEMASIITGSALSKSITHNAAGLTPNCSDVTDAWNSGDPQNSSLQDPSGGLFGGGAVVNSAQGTYTNYDAVALDGFFAAGQTRHTSPESLLPSLAEAGPRSIVFNEGRVIASNWRPLATTGLDTAPGTQIDGVSAVFMAESIFNEFTTETDFNGLSEWVVTFPTKRFYADPGTNGNATAAIRPFTKLFLPTASGAAGANTGQACEALAFDFRDREERRPGTVGVGFSPQPPGVPPNSLCYETNVITFNQTIGGDAINSTPSAIFGSVLARNLAPRISGGPAVAGYTSVNLSVNPGQAPRRMRRSLFTTESAVPTSGTGGHIFSGLPVTGFWAVSLENRNALPGVRGFYGGAYSHKRNRTCEGTTAAAGGGLCF
jgi:hypothetical protein